MKLELPPERQLPNAEWMVERILAERHAAATPRPAARMYWLSGLVAAAVVIIAAVIGWAVLLPTGRPQVGAAPETSAAVSGGPSSAAGQTVGPSTVSPVPTPGPTSTSAVPRQRGSQKPPPTSLAPTRAASSANGPKRSAEVRTPSAAKTSSEERSAEPPLTTTVPIGVRVHAPYLDLTASGTMTGGDVYAILVETCVRSLPPNASDLPLSRSSWTLSTSAGTVRTDAPITDPITLPSAYPAEGRYGIGDCASGWIPFAVAPDTAVSAISYRNTLGANITWNPNT
jgi:hypothetical protein